MYIEVSTKKEIIYIITTIEIEIKNETESFVSIMTKCGPREVLIK